MSRHPYTYAADYVRHFAGYGPEGTKLSRSDASQVIVGIAEALGMGTEELAIKLSEYQQKHAEQIAKEGVRRYMQVIEIHSHT